MKSKIKTIEVEKKLDDFIKVGKISKEHIFGIKQSDLVILPYEDGSFAEGSDEVFQYLKENLQDVRVEICTGDDYEETHLYAELTISISLYILSSLVLPYVFEKIMDFIIGKFKNKVDKKDSNIHFNSYIRKKTKTGEKVFNSTFDGNVEDFGEYIKIIKDL
jgi:hypothetical protein